MWNRRDIVKAGAVLTTATALGRPAFAQGGGEKVAVDLRREIGPLDHIWSRSVGSDRAAMTLREGWRQDLDRFHKEAGLERVRFHGIFADELGVWSAGAKPNFQYVDAVYDGLLERGVQPFVELSFMPRKLASGSKKFGFYGANITPPTSLANWSSFITTFVQHLVDRYGREEVRQWYFEVWNEPNLTFFFSGTQADYFQLYKATAAAVKAVDPALKVGGPSTSAVQWIDSFLAFCAANDCPLDFVSTHIYAGDDQKQVFGRDRALKQYQVIPAAMEMVRRQIDATRFKGAELWLSEWSSDSPAMIAHVIANCLPYCHSMSHWAMSNWYEEVGVLNFVLKEGDNGWGMLARGGIAKPQFNTYKLLNRLGTRRLASTGPALASRTEEGASVMVWNLADVQQPAGLPGMSSTRTVSGVPKSLDVTFRGAAAGAAARIRYVDMERGSPFPTWRKLGSPQYPTPAQMEQIRASAEIAAPETRQLGKGGNLSINLPPEGVALIELVEAR
jgi:xylan 1,4-beta-xylosidase